MVPPPILSPPATNLPDDEGDEENLWDFNCELGVPDEDPLWKEESRIVLAAQPWNPLEMERSLADITANEATTTARLDDFMDKKKQSEELTSIKPKYLIF